MLSVCMKLVLGAHFSVNYCCVGFWWRLSDKYSLGGRCLVRYCVPASTPCVDCSVVRRARYAPPHDRCRGDLSLCSALTRAGLPPNKVTIEHDPQIKKTNAS